MALVPHSFVTVTLTMAPAGSAGDAAVIADAELTAKLEALVQPLVVPNLTSLAPVKSVPVMVTLVPPALGPLFGSTLVTVGGGPPKAKPCSSPTAILLTPSRSLAHGVVSV